MSSNERIVRMEAEALLWWKLHQEGLALYRADPSDPALAPLLDDLEVMQMHSDWLLMRRKCAECLVRVAERTAAAVGLAVVVFGPWADYADLLSVAAA